LFQTRQTMHLVLPHAILSTQNVGVMEYAGTYIFVILIWSLISCR